MNTTMNAQQITPQEEVLRYCQKFANNTVWAIALLMDEHGNYIWEVYCDDSKKIKKIPKRYKNFSIKTVFCERPKI